MTVTTPPLRPADFLKLVQEKADKQRAKNARITDFFTEETHRVEDLSASACGIYLDISKQLFSRHDFQQLLVACDETGLRDKRTDLFAGEKINITEGRSVLHMALRASEGDSFAVEGQDLLPQIMSVRKRLYDFANAVRSGAWCGYTGKQIRHIVNIGIGGSDLGPAMVTKALSFYQQEELSVDFVSNVDGQHLAEIIAPFDPEETLFVVASKTFTTQETLTNAHSARQWVLDQVKDEAAIAQHFVAVSTNQTEVEKFGIKPAQMFEFWDWVGGRFSLWSAIGLPIILAIGPEKFEEFLSGAREMDHHFQTAETAQNLPILLALTGLWNVNGLGKEILAVLPYSQGLSLLPPYLQQAEMESNGKSISLSGQEVTGTTCPVVFGQAGTNGQHAFYQLLHQGTVPCACDFILPIKTHYPLGDHHEKLVANFLAQQEALMCGRSVDMAADLMKAEGKSEEQINSLKAHRSFHGNVPSCAILMEDLSPYHLGALIALYEHKIFVQGFFWDINSFDQWGVELGKQLASRLLPKIKQGLEADLSDLDPSTKALFRHITKRLG